VLGPDNLQTTKPAVQTQQLSQVAQMAQIALEVIQLLY
jgi:hypothetical protein